MTSPPKFTESHDSAARTISQVPDKSPLIVRTNRFSRTRSESGMSMHEVAYYAKVSVSSICRIEQGKSPSIETAFALARFFETTVDELFADFAAPKK